MTKSSFHDENNDLTKSSTIRTNIIILNMTKFLEAIFGEFHFYIPVAVKVETHYVKTKTF
jgi:hypothetical protein